MFRSLLLFLFFLPLIVSSQIIQIPDHTDSVDLTFSGTRINPYNQAYDKSGKVIMSGYIDTYFAHYSDSVNSNGYEKFPTISPRNNQFGINILQLSAKYQSNHFRGTATLFGGDCPSAAWSPFLNFIQEANVGFKVVKKLWFDMGFFRTHIGLESIQPRENMALSLATTTYYEPYFLSGAKLTWQHSDKLTIQVNAFNSFNQFIETNKNKAVGISISYNPTSKIRTSFSSIVCNEAPNGAIQQLRSYSNFCFIYNAQKVILGWEGNLGFESHAQLANPTKSAFMASSLLAAKYRFTPKWAVYGRGELFYDPNEILTGPVFNTNHSIVGEDLVGITHGYEFKPIPNSFIRVEGRWLNNWSNALFSMNGNASKNRLEILFGIGLWF